MCGRQEGKRSSGKVKVESMSTTSTGHHRYNRHHNRYKTTAVTTNSFRGEGLTEAVIHEPDSEGCIANFQEKKREQRSGAEAWRSRRKGLAFWRTGCGELGAQLPGRELGRSG